MTPQWLDELWIFSSAVAVRPALLVSKNPPFVSKDSP